MIIRKKSGLKRAKKSGRMRIKNSSQLGRKNISINEKLALYLNDALSIENAAIKRLELRLRQTRLPDIKVQLQRHLDETKEQQSRLKQLISSLDQKPTNDRGRLPVTSSPKSIEKMLKKSMTDAEEELKGAKEDAIIESAEICTLRYAYSVCTKSISSSGRRCNPYFISKSGRRKSYVGLDKSKYACSYNTTLARYYILCCRYRRSRNRSISTKWGIVD